MRTYLRTIHKRSDAHKKRFALLSSAAITLIIFGVWSTLRFSPAVATSDTVATSDSVYPQNETANAVTPISNITAGIADSFKALKDQFNSVKGDVKSVNLDSQYTQIRNEAVNTPTQ